MKKIDFDSVPSKPGCYLWKDINDEVIYVGKAKDLKKRMKQYFSNDYEGRLKILTSKINDYEYKITPSEYDALLLELTLINKYNPKYNLKIKNSKLYPYIELHYNPQFGLKISRKPTKNKSKFFGPFPDGYGARTIVKLFNEVFPLSKCKAPNSNRKCINYEIGKCLGYCIKNKKDIDFSFYEKIIVDFFKGKINSFKIFLNKKIDELSEAKNFEKAALIMEQIRYLENYKKTQYTVFNDSRNVDIINYYFKNQILSISISHIRFGKLVSISNFISKIYGLSHEDSFIQFIDSYYKKNTLPEKFVFEKELYDFNFLKDKEIVIPKKGKYLKLLDSTYLDAKTKLLKDFNSIERKYKKWEESFDKLSKLLKKEINSIEMIDISNMGDESIVGTIVNYNIQGKNKEMYRKYILKEVDKQNDYKSMEEVSYRHLRRCLINKSLPSVFLIDGKNQLKSVKRIKNDLKLNISLLALKKDLRHNTSTLLFEDMTEMDLSKNNDLLLFFSLIQSESHRFTVDFMNSNRSKNILKSSLENIKGLTKEDINLLFSKFKTVRQLKIANFNDIVKVLGKAKAKKLIEYI